MSTKYIKPTAVKKHVSSLGRQITPDAIKALDRVVERTIDRAIQRLGSFKRIRPAEVFGGTDGSN